MIDTTSLIDELVQALEGVIRVADRKTIEFDAARTAVAKAREKKNDLIVKETEEKYRTSFENWCKRMGYSKEIQGSDTMQYMWTAWYYSRIYDKEPGKGKSK